jgi:hypothetical protein
MMIMAGLLRPIELKEISAKAEMAKMEEERQHKRKKEQLAAELREAFMARDVLSDAIDRVNRAVSVAAEQGLHQIEVVTFPVKYCNDNGRSINNFDPDWPKSLEGYAKKAYSFYEKELRPLGYKVHAEVISFPDGMPGEAALYLKW